MAKFKLGDRVRVVRLNKSERLRSEQQDLTMAMYKLNYGEPCVIQEVCSCSFFAGGQPHYWIHGTKYNKLFATEDWLELLTPRCPCEMCMERMANENS